MRPISYRDLLHALQELDSDALDMSVSIFDTNSLEVFPVFETTFVSELPTKQRYALEDVVEPEQPLLVTQI